MSAGAILLAASFLAAPTRTVVDRIVAVVNGEPISLLDLQDALHEPGAPSSEKQVLEMLVEKKLVEKEAARLNVGVTDREVELAIEDVRRQNALSEEGLKAAVKRQGMDWDEYRRQIREQIQRVKLVNQEVRSKVTLTDEEIRSYYDEHRKDFLRPPQAVASEVILAVPKGGDETGALERARKARGLLLAGRTPTDAADEVRGSQDQLGPYAQGELVGALDDALWSLKPGEVSAPLRIPIGYVVLRLIQRTPSEAQPLEQVRSQIQDALFKEKADRYFKEWLAEVKARSLIERHWEPPE